MNNIRDPIFLLHTKSCHPFIPHLFLIYNHNKVKWLCAYFEQLNPRQTDRTIMRIRAIKIANTISFIFMFCSHIFLRILVPEFLKSCAWLKKGPKVNRKQKQFIFKTPIICFIPFRSPPFFWGGKEGRSYQERQIQDQSKE